MTKYKVAIDGPAGSGKSTISKIVAQRLNLTHIDTGAMYRAVTLIALEKQLDLHDEMSYKFLEDIDIEYRNNQIYVDDRNVSEDIRNDQVTTNVSLVSSFPYVRSKLVAIQQNAILNGGIIMDGRDIGTVVIPNAEVKIFLTAHVEERAKRRLKQQKKDIQDKLDSAIKDIELRDKKDSARTVSPLRQAADAIVLDTTHLTLDETVEAIIDIILKKTSSSLTDKGVNTDE